MADDLDETLKDFYYITNYSAYADIQMKNNYVEEVVEYEWKRALHKESTTKEGATLSPSSTFSLSSSTRSTSFDSTTTSSTTSSSTTFSSTTAMLTNYLLTATEDTPLDTFLALIRAMPDQGTGLQIVFPNIPYYTYVTKLTAAQAADLESQPWVRWIFPNTISEDMMDGPANRMD